MLLIVASAADDQASALVERWRSVDARLVTPFDLSADGWEYRVGDSAAGHLACGAVRLPVAEVSGVLVRLPSVLPAELSHIAREDRDYIAAEMSAFLIAWLTKLPCPVLNRPSATSIAGPCWRTERWIAEASRLGIPCTSIRRSADLAQSSSDAYIGSAPSSATEVVVAGDRWIGDVDASLGTQAVRLAHAAGASLLSVFYDGPRAGARLLTASPIVDPSRPEIADGILDCLAGVSSVTEPVTR